MTVRRWMAGVAAVAMVSVLGTSVGARASVNDEASSVSGPGIVVPFVPGPPLWRPAVDRLRPLVKTTDLDVVVDQCVSDAMAAMDTPGAAVAVVVDGTVVYEQGYGFTRRNGSDPVDADTQFRIGSVTKMLTAAAVMQQVEAGTVALDDPLSRFVPELELLGPWPADEITVERLLTHASGIPDLSFSPAGLTGDDALSHWAASLTWVGLHAPPGAFFNYSNPNYNLAGLVVERASGMPYRAYMDAHVFGPAGMTKTTFDPAAVVARGNAAYGHLADGQGGETVYAPDQYDNGAFAPAGYAFSTAGDLVRWAMLLSEGGGDVLSPTSAAAMQTLQRSLQTIPGIGYGYGVFVEPFYDLTVREHGGNIWGWGAYLLWQPERRFAVAVLANTFSSLPDAAYCIADEVLEPDHTAVQELPPLDPGRMALFEGRYDASVTTAWSASSPYPIMAELSAYDDDSMFLHLWDPDSPWDALWGLDHAALDVFYVDVDMDGVYDLDATLLVSEGSPERTRWLRMRQLVGHPQVEPRAGGRLVP